MAPTHCYCMGSSYCKATNLIVCVEYLHYFCFIMHTCGQFCPKINVDSGMERTARNKFQKACFSLISVVKNIFAKEEKILSHVCFSTGNLKSAKPEKTT